MGRHLSLSLSLRLSLHGRCPSKAELRARVTDTPPVPAALPSAAHAAPAGRAGAHRALRAPALALLVALLGLAVVVTARWSPAGSPPAPTSSAAILLAPARDAGSPDAGALEAGAPDAPAPDAVAPKAPALLPCWPVDAQAPAFTALGVQPVGKRKGPRPPSESLGSWIERTSEGKPVVLVVAATWCVPCREELPGLRELGRTYGDRARLVGLLVDEDPASADRDALQAFLDAGMPVAFAPEAPAALSARALPVLVTVPADRSDARACPGAAFEKTPRGRQLEAWLDRL